MDETETDAIVITKDNDILFEKYNNKNDEEFTTYIIFSF